MAATVAYVRVLIGDPDDGSPELTDEQIQAILDEEGSAYRAGAVCARAIAAKYTAKADIALGPLKKSSAQQFKHWMQVAHGLALRDGGQLDGGPAHSGTSKATTTAVREQTDRIGSPFYAGQFSAPTWDD